MTTNQKKAVIKKYVKDMMKESHKVMIKRIDKALNSGAIDIDAYDPHNNFMILPRVILIAILESEADQYKPGAGSYWHRPMKKEVNNIRYFI